ncbi:unnamed protein product [Caenorhabditis auriculariae]|uniref:Piwi domain-containing protein n=1 Tax=Caenorhabditis auriculariae TaxID=2777116 RepID=A0A8S1HSM7_9PELO|nr:unnamed protein product [Caenorhabditis auriculariae]
MDVQSASVASIVGNIDHTLMQWDVSYRVQPKGIERIVHMRDEIMARIRKFRMETGKLPKHIIVYRDGVSESEFQRALYNEKTDINVACKDIYGDNPHPTLTYIVVTKRHRTRFFPTTVDEDASELVSKSDRETRKQSCISTSSDNACRYNVAPGTLVETEITSPDYFDFYLVSQASPLGTAHPTHYYVLHDDWNPSPSFWQTVSYALCCSYMRCPKTISVPTPIMLAHLAAKRGKEYLEAINNRNRELVLTSKNRCEGWNHLLEHMTHPEDHIGMHFV